jgi:aminoglycoside phosphotransferase (APT) family kinase protein
VSSAQTRHARRLGLPPAAREWVRDTLAPGGRVVRVRPLRGGISSSVHLAQLVDREGVRQAVVVRRYGEYWQRVDPAACGREFALLQALERARFSAPRPLLLDAEGGPFGAPTVIMTRLPGRPLLWPYDLEDYLHQMAVKLAELHSLPTGGLDFLPRQRDMVLTSLASRAQTDDPLQSAVCDAAVAAWPRVSESAPRRVLVHGDYWPGNLLWLRRRLVGVVDWEQPRLGEAAKDVATCRGDLAVLFGQAVADAFVTHYEAAAGQPVQDLPFWDVFVSTWAVPEIDEWIGAYHVLGRRDLTPDIARERIRRFARVALERL